MARKKIMKTKIKTRAKTKNKSMKTVEGDLCFFVNDGKTIQNMGQLTGVLSEISDETYSYHVNSEKNDFASWISDVFGHRKLANELRRVKTKETALKKVDAHLNLLKK